MKRIVHYSSGFASTAGGVESVVRSILDAFRGDMEYQFTILSRYAHSTSECYKQFRQQGDRIHSFDIQHLTPGNMRTFRNMLREYFAENKVDVLHFHGTDEPFVIEEARRSGVKKIIVHIHRPTREHKGLRRLYGLPKKWIAGRNVRMADAVLAVSQDSADATARQLGMEPGKIQVVNNCIDTNAVCFREADRQQYRQELGLVGPAIGHIGRFVDVKNHRFLLEIFHSFLGKAPDAKLVLVGDGPLRPEMEQLAAEMGMKDRVLFLGERMDVTQLLCAMDAFVLPSKFEGFGLVALEAQSTGLPCLLANTVPQKVAVTDLAAYCRLEDGAAVWSDQLWELLQQKKERTHYSEIIAQSGYGILELQKTMKALYEFS